MSDLTFTSNLPKYVLIHTDTSLLLKIQKSSAYKTLGFFSVIFVFFHTKTFHPPRPPVSFIPTYLSSDQGLHTSILSTFPLPTNGCHLPPSPTSSAFRFQWHFPNQAPDQGHCSEKTRTSQKTVPLGVLSLASDGHRDSLTHCCLSKLSLAITPLAI